MPEADTGSDLDQLRVFCRGERALFDAERVSRAPDERRVTHRLGRGQQQQSLRCLGQLTGALEVVILEVAREVCRREKLEAAGELRCAHAPRQIEQSERVAAGLRDDAVADAVVEPTRDGAHEQGARILLGQARAAAARAGRRSRAWCSARGRRPRSPPIPPAAVARRSRGSVPRRRRAIARPPRDRAAAAPRPRRTAGRARRVRPGTGPGRHRMRGPGRRSARPAAAAAARRAGRAAARRADGSRRTAAPSPPPRP